jgi:hypothetical protein
LKIFGKGVREDLYERRLRSVDEEEKPIPPRCRINLRYEAIRAHALSTELQRVRAIPARQGGPNTADVTRLTVDPARNAAIADRRDADVGLVWLIFGVPYAADRALRSRRESLPLL